MTPGERGVHKTTPITPKKTPINRLYSYRQTLIIVMAILKEIVDWAEDKSQFWQAAVDMLIRTNKIDSADLDYLIKVCKTEYCLSNFNYVPIDFDQLRLFIQNTSGDADVSLVSIKDIDNISALSKTSQLE